MCVDVKFSLFQFTRMYTKHVVVMLKYSLLVTFRKLLLVLSLYLRAILSQLNVTFGQALTNICNTLVLCILRFDEVYFKYSPLKFLYYL